MARHLIHVAIFLAGLAVVCWIGAAYAGSNPLALAVTMLVGACYLAGAFELQRYQRATATLTRMVEGLSQAPAQLGSWLDQLHPSLRGATRLRIEGERAALPGPTLTPYLVGLLVLLGMLGTFLGMVATLRGTGLALESATDLQAIRASLAAPVKGLGFAFGTSVAGVATSAMLGLLSALCRRERIQAGQMLDAKIATTLRVYSQTHQREEVFRLLQRQADVMPALVDRLQSMMTAMERHSEALHERLAASQDAFQGKTVEAYTRLTTSVEQSLKDSAAASAHAAGAAIQPAVEATMASLARESALWHGTVTESVREHLDGLSTRFEATTATVADIWTQALAGHQRTSEALALDLRTSLVQAAGTFEQRSTGLLEGMSERSAAVLEGMSERSTVVLETLADRSGGVLETFADRTGGLLDNVAERSTSLLETLADRTGTVLDTFANRTGGLLDNLGQRSDSLLETLADRSEGLLDGVSGRLDTAVSNISRTWTDALAQHERVSQKQAHDNQQALAAAAATFEQHSASLLHTLGQAQAELQDGLAARDEQRMAAWTGALGSMAAALRQEWEQAGVQTANRQQEICDVLARTAHDMASQAQAHASATIAEIARLLQAASEAPRAAAEVVAELRQKLSDSMARDNAMLEERGRLLETLGTLLDAVNHASTEQRAAVDALVATSADLLDRVGTRFTDKVQAETGKLAEVAAQVTGSAVEVASLGEAFGMAVQAFSLSNETLVAHLQRIEGALDKSITRSDEQLAYYVAQAREVIDLSMLSQKQIIEDLQQLASQRAPSGTEAA
jgi:hypothetical protein